MIPKINTAKWALVVLSALLLTSTGCARHRKGHSAEPLPMLGAMSDAVWQNQERNAEASEFVIYGHEFKKGTFRLNTAGEDHVKQIAYRLQAGQDLPVVIERSMSSSRPGTEYGYPVHPNPELHKRRREIIVRSLVAMGIPDAGQRVVVAPAFAEGMSATEAEAAYYQGLGRQGFSGGFGAFNAFGRFGGF